MQIFRRFYEKKYTRPIIACLLFDRFILHKSPYCDPLPAEEWSLDDQSIRQEGENAGRNRTVDFAVSESLMKNMYLLQALYKLYYTRHEVLIVIMCLQ